MDLSDMTIVITGASSGLGKGMAEWFSSNGAAIGVLARNAPDIYGDAVVSRSVDVTEFQALTSFAAEVSAALGPIDLWVNNAAVLEPVKPQRDLAADELMSHLEINVAGVLNGTKAYLGQLESDGHTGALVNITSGLAQRGRAGLTAYSSAKAGVDRLTEIVRLEEPDLLRLAIAVSPGVIETGMQENLRSQDSEVLHDVDMFKERKAKGEMNTRERVAEHIARWVFGPDTPEGMVQRVPIAD